MKDFEEKLDEQLNKLPFTKHLDDGQYNDGQIAGFELGARWLLSEITSANQINVNQLPDDIKFKRTIDGVLYTITPFLKYEEKEIPYFLLATGITIELRLKQLWISDQGDLYWDWVPENK